MDAEKDLPASEAGTGIIPEDDIAPVAAFLAGEGCRYLTGNTLFVDGAGHINGVAWAPDLPESG